MTTDLLPLVHLREWIAEGALPATPEPALASRMAIAAELQGVAGQLAEAVRTLPGWPPETREHLGRLERLLLVRVVRQLDLAARVHRLLLARGLRSLPLKGVALAERLYDSPAHRAMGDVDVLALDDWHACARALEAEGFRRLPGGDHAAPFVDPETGFALELHLSPVSCPGLFPFDPNGLWERSQPGCGQVPRIPASEDLLVQLALHTAFQHGLVMTLGQHLDLRRLVERESLDPDRLRARASEARAERSLAAALRAAERVVGLRLPPPIQRLVTTAPLPRVLLQRLEPRRALALLAPASPALTSMRLALVPGRRLALIRRTLFARPVGSQLSPLSRVVHVSRRVLRLAFRVASQKHVDGGA